MTDKIRKTLIAVALLAAFALGGAAVAGAVQGGSGNDNAAATTTSTTQDDDQQQPQNRPQRSDETLLTGETAEKVRAAALAEFEGATIERLETDGDGNAAYEAHMIKADGSRVTVYVNRDFEVVGSEEGHGRGHGGPRPDSDSDDNEDSEQS
jgi:uncharacterized membrane protein YkoI